MDIIITIIFILSPTEYILKPIKINQPCEVWYEEHLIHDSEKNIHYINGIQSMGYICGAVAPQ